MKNPWLNISQDKSIAETDRNQLIKTYGSIESFEKKYSRNKLIKKEL